MIQETRVKDLNLKPVNTEGEYVLYWVRKAPRVKFNHALNYSIEIANKNNAPVLCVYEINPNIPFGNDRNFTFLLQGLKELSENLKELKIKLVVINRNNDLKTLFQLAEKSCMLVSEKNYLTYGINQSLKFSEKINVKFVEVETNLTVPVKVASNKQEYMAHFFRSKIEKHLDEYLLPLSQIIPTKSSLNLKLKSEDISNVKTFVEKLKIDKSVKPSPLFVGGETEAKKHLDIFIENKIKDYEKYRNNPELNFQSNLSPYLHFGFISPIKVALSVKKNAPNYQKEFLDELITWRELAHNFTYYNKNYSKFSCLPNWAKQTLNKHKKDEREYLYNLEHLENYKTHDVYWNACQKQMVKTGKMHGYMRMYWGKKVIEWSKTPQIAYKNLIYLNNKYELDGRDPSGYAGIAWCFGLHDRPWFEREVFGTVRFMAQSGLKKKFDIEKYVSVIERL